MKHFNSIVLLTSALFLAGCGVNPSSLVPAKSTDSTKSAPSTETPKTVSQSLKDLLALGTAQKCTWTSTADGNTMTGTILIKDKKFKQTGSITTQGETPIESNTISDGTNIYIWTNLANKTGIKMKLDAVPSPQPNAQDSAQKFDINQKMDMNCSAATVSDADLALPSDITFTDFSETMKDLQKIDINKLQQQFGDGQ